jgi:lactate dehydrogenase-like 2-hydroxyacid dehydrogenase
MSKPSVLVVAPIPPELERRLAASFELDRDKEAPDPAHRVVVTTSVAGADAALMQALPNLELIACNGAGLEQIDVGEAEKRGIVVCNTPDAVTEDTADFALGLMYATSRRIAEGDRFVRAGRWGRERMSPSRRLYSRRLGIVGLGRIGSAIAWRAAAIGMEVSYTATGPKDVPYAFVASVKELASRVDVLVLSCSGGPSTYRIVDRDVLAALGPDGILINVSRGSVVDEEALIAALASGKIAGAGLDVFENEPAIDPRFLDVPNVVLQPHYAAVTKETREDIADTLHAAIAGVFGRQ